MIEEEDKLLRHDFKCVITKHMIELEATSHDDTDLLVMRKDRGFLHILIRTNDEYILDVLKMYYPQSKKVSSQENTIRMEIKTREFYITDEEINSNTGFGFVFF